MKPLALFLIFSNVLGTIKATRFSDEYDITNDLNDTITLIIQIVGPLNIAKLIHSVANDEVGDNTATYTYNHTWLGGSVDEKTIRNIRIAQVSFDTSHTLFSYKILDNKMQLYSREVVVRLHGEAEPVYPSIYRFDDFISTMRFSGCEISVQKLSNISGDSFLIDLQYNHINVDTEGRITEWTSVKKGLERILPAVLRTHINCNAKLSDILREMYDNLSSKHIISKYPHYFGHEHLYHYLIPNIPLATYNLSNIVVKGLSNFHSVNFTSNFRTLAYTTLLIKDIRGSMFLENIVGTPSSNVELHFFIGSLSISIAHSINRTISVEGVNYSINGTKFNTGLMDLQSDFMHHIELAIGSSIMPSAKFQRTNRPSHFSSRSDMVNAIRRLFPEKSLESDEKNTKAPQKTWIPIDDKNIGNKSSQGIINVYNQFSFSNVRVCVGDINFITGNERNEQQIQCPLHENSLFSQLINTSPSTKLHRNDDNSIDINFHFDSPSLNISKIKRNNTKENNSCEIQISNNQPIKVVASLLQSNTTRSNETQLEIKNKIDASLMSMMNQRVVQTIKSMACSSFDVCSITVQMVNKFFSNFVDTVLQKCSLRRNTTYK